MNFHFNTSSRSGVIVRTMFEIKNQQRAITQKICMLELWPLRTALPIIMLFPYMKFYFNRSNRSGEIVRTKFERKNSTKGNNSNKYVGYSYGPCALHFLSSWYFHIWSFISIAEVEQELSSGQDVRQTDRQTDGPTYQHFGFTGFL